MSENNKPSMNQQDHPHREGQQNNTPPQTEEQRGSQNNTQQLSDMGANDGNQPARREAQQDEGQP